MLNKWKQKMKNENMELDFKDFCRLRLGCGLNIRNIFSTNNTMRTQNGESLHKPSGTGKTFSI